MKNKNVFDDALTRCVNETMAKDVLTQHDIDNLLKAASIEANLSRNETDVYKADKEAEAEKYAADKKAAADIERAKAEKEIAKIRAEADMAKVEAEKYAADVRAQSESERSEAERYSADKRAEADKNRAEAERYSADRHSESEKYAADERAEAEKEAAKIKAEADERAYRHQFWGNVITGGLKVAEGVITVGAVVVMFKSGLDFEQTGVITSNTMKNIMANGLKLLKR
jgi:membrane protein involved in colicin uptake